MTAYERDKNRYFNYGDSNGSRPMSWAFWNLVISMRDVGLFCEGISPNRHWRLKHVKAYFGIKGSKERILEQLNELYEEHILLMELKERQ